MVNRIFAILREHRWMVLLALAFLAFGLLRLNDLSLFTDSTRYVIWGTSVGHAQGFVDMTQPEPERYVVNAPFFSVLLSPALLFFPFSLLAAKVVTLFWGMAFLAGFYAFVHRLAGKTVAVFALVPLVVNPLLLLLSTEVLSETAFLAFLLAALVLLERAGDTRSLKSRDFLFLLLIISLVALLREVAVALVGSVILYFLLRRNYARAAAIFVGFAALFGLWLYRNLILVGVPPSSQATNLNYVFQHFLTPPDASLLKEFGLRIVNNFSGYATHLGGMLLFPVPEVLIVEPTTPFHLVYRILGIAAKIVPPVFLVLLAIGIWRDIVGRRTWIVRALFVVSYLTIVLVYPVHDIRFLLPLLPFSILYPAFALLWFRERWLPQPRLRSVLVTVLLAVIVVPNSLTLFELERTNWRYTINPLGFYDHLRQAGLDKNMFSKPWRILGDTIRARTPNGSTIAAAMKDVSIFVGDRKTLELTNSVPVTTFNEYLRKYAAEYVLATSSWDNFQSYEFQMTESNRFWFEPVARVAGMALLKVHSTNLTPRDEWLLSKRVAVDTVTANGLLRKGRVELIRGKFEAAIASFLRAKQLASGQALIPAQLAIAYAMSGQLREANEQLQSLFSYGQGPTYMPLVTRHLAVAQIQQRARQMDNPVQRSLVEFDVASFYWNFGYPGLAYSTIRQVLTQDSTFFKGLLWGWHYGMQRGDTAQAKIYLRSLQRIDRGNPVVVQFGIIERNEDTLSRATDPSRRSALRLAIAQAYKSVDLPDEAVDEAQRALRDDPRNVNGWLFQARLFNEKKAPWAARAAYERAIKLDPSNTEALTALSSRQ